MRTTGFMGGRIEFFQSAEFYFRPEKFSHKYSECFTIDITVKAEDFVRLLPEHDMTPALEIMAEVRAYFQGKVFI